MNSIVKKSITVILIVILTVSEVSLSVFGEDIKSDNNDNTTAEIQDKNPSMIDDGLTQEQRNSLAMLNYLRVLSTSINASSNSKLYLEEAYNTILDNVSPNAIDRRTQKEFNQLLNTIEVYRMVNLKRNRLQYIYEQNKAQAIRNAIPNPLPLLSIAASRDLTQLAVPVVYMAIDAVASYESSMAKTDLQYLKDNWALDDEATEALHQSRVNMFNYMIDIVQANDLPDNYTLTEDDIEEFVSYQSKDTDRKIRYLERNKQKYQFFGEYWLTLAESYYDSERYSDCIEALDSYEKLNIKIFREDHDLAKIAPLAIVASEKCITKKGELISRLEHYVQIIESNTRPSNNWALRYFAAQTLINLAALSGNNKYLQNAYDLAYDNVNYLVDEQKSLNTKYLADIKSETASYPATMTAKQKKEAKKEVDKFNKMLKEIRKTELPPVYEPLLLNCDLLYALANKLEKTENEKVKIDSMLHGSKGEPLFLNHSLDNRFWFTNHGETAPFYAEFDKDTIVFSAAYTSDNSQITVTIKNEQVETLADDWSVKSVKRNKSHSVDDFAVTYTSETLKKHSYSNGDRVTVTLVPSTSIDVEPVIIEFEVKVSKRLNVFNSIEFVQVDK